MRADFRIFRFAVRTCSAVAVAAVLVWLAAKALSPGGTLSVSADLIGPTPFVSDPMPSARVLFPGAGSDGDRAEIVGDPIYLDFSPPPGFDYVDVSFRYRDGIQPDVRLGALVSALDQSYDMRPAGNALLDSLPWHRLSSGRFTLWTKGTSPVSFDGFLNDPPPREKTAALGRVPLPPYRLAGYEPTAAARTVVRSLRGQHRFLAYVKDETLNFSFSVQDMNREAGADPVIVSVYPETAAGSAGGPAQPLARTVLQDDGDTADDQRQSGLRTVSVSVADLTEGVYAVEFTADPDVFIRSFVTSQRKVVLEGRAYLGDHVGYSDQPATATLWASGRHVTARTAHPEGLQTLTVAGTPLTLSDLHLKSAAPLPASGPAAVRAPAGDVLLTTDGVFALSRESHFDPLPFAPDWSTTAGDLERRGITAVIADYEQPETVGDDRIARATFDLGSMARTDEGAYRLVVSAPGIDLSGRRLPVTSVTLTLRRRPASWGEAWRRFTAQPSGGTEEGGRLPGAATFGENPK